ncbi:alpha/beta hydrolase [Paracoccus siganidrum]|uniref:Alpha/beta hydrolase n=1 Tax=Paracoccus siganidrum TaxID=1276757 RepID=A0A419A6X2_9RHOB|nr:alpha/beta hydrolase [Paracoccus siganidrum]RJL14822.1 alpha/beta hydrolase [Paracoccus siganidrum]RMC30000.1 alpha/beta hydrolase [Paracoccus siganidrum]
MKQRFTLEAAGQDFSGKLAQPDGGQAGLPVLLAIHGGTYDCDYFDIPGHSLLDRAVAWGFHVVAIDRPGYGNSTPLPDAPDLIQKNAEALNAALPDLLAALGLAGRPVCLIGHSIGGAVALTLAALCEGWPLAGVAVSGVGAETPSESAEAYAQMPRQYFVELPGPVKDQVMFGPEGSYPPDMPAASHAAHRPVPLSELTDITGGWQDRLAGIAARIRVPVHYRQGEHERLWLVSAARVEDFARLFTASPQVDAELVPGAGHCIDYHLAGPAFQDEQLDFAALLESAEAQP